MFPILETFQLPMLDWVIQIRAYPTMHLVAFVVLIVVTLRLYARDVGPPWPVLDVLLVAVPVSMVGARLLAAWTSGDNLHGIPFLNPKGWWLGSKSAYGGLVAGLAAGLIVARLKGLPIARALDSAAPALALGVFFARIGCFLGGCCWGAPTDSFLGLHFPPGHPGMSNLPVGDPLGLHPTQLYLAASALSIFVILMVLRRRGKGAPGVRFMIGIGLYAASVLGIEFLRMDSGRWFALGLSHSQWISLLLLLASSGLLLRRRLAARFEPVSQALEMSRRRTGEAV